MDVGCCWRAAVVFAPVRGCNGSNELFTIRKAIKVGYSPIFHTMADGLRLRVLRQDPHVSFDFLPVKSTLPPSLRRKIVLDIARRSLFAGFMGINTVQNHTANPYFQHTEPEPPWRNEDRKPKIYPQINEAKPCQNFQNVFTV